MWKDWATNMTKIARTTNLTKFYGCDRIKEVVGSLNGSWSLLLNVLESLIPKRLISGEIIGWGNSDQTATYTQAKVKHTPQDSRNEFIIRRWNTLLVVDFRFISVYLQAHWAVNSHARQLWKFFQLSFPEFDVNSFKDFQSDQIWRNSRKIFTAHYACRSVDL